MSLILYFAGLPVIWLAVIIIGEAVISAFDRPFGAPRISSRTLAAAIKTRESI